jgi:cytochrome c oxidase assembly protein subunit 15
MKELLETKRIVKVWLILGLVMIFFQIVLGGITRLTGSGLSITKWDIVIGSVPPLSEESWQKEFGLYQQTPQYHKINKGMTLADFKFIFFWEFIHRLWARSMGFVFLIPLVYFIAKGYIRKELGKKLFRVFLLAVLVASVGWIMVASGLINRPWVNAYKLSFHLVLAVILFTYLLWIIYEVNINNTKITGIRNYKKYILGLSLLIFIQIFLGGMMSGMKAGLMYTTWPTIGGKYFPVILFKNDNWIISNLIFYDKNVFMPTLVQFLHRNVAYFIFIYGIILSIKILQKSKSILLTKGTYMFISLLLIQVLLGIFTLINCIGKVPLLLGVLHQSIAILLLGSSFFILYISKDNKT